jgi:hypothetical protein
MNEIEEHELVTEAECTISKGDERLPVIVDLPAMSEAEYETLAKLEASISDSWWKIGQAFAEIKAKKLYRQTKDGTRQTWEEYCKDVHSLSKQQVDKYIRAAEVRQTLETETKVSVLPATVSQAAELSGLEPAEMAKATEEAVTTAASDNRKPTTNDFKQAARKNANKRKMGNVVPKATANKELKKLEKLPANKSIAAKSRIVLNINTVTLIGPIREMLEDCQLTAKTTTIAKGTSFSCDASGDGLQSLLKSLSNLVEVNGPVDIQISLD